MVRKKESSRIRLGRLETEIMNVVWHKGAVTVHDVRDALAKGAKPAYTTILTMMRKLEAKGYLAHDVKGRKFVYRATVDREEVRRSVIADLLHRLFDGSPALLVNSLLEQADLTEAELSEIQRLIRKREKGS